MLAADPRRHRGIDRDDPEGRECIGIAGAGGDLGVLGHRRDRESRQQGGYHGNEGKGADRVSAHVAHHVVDRSAQGERPAMPVRVSDLRPSAWPRKTRRRAELRAGMIAEGHP
jgi:hypothetical protein